MDLVVATLAKDVPTDFYAAAVTACVVIVFAKFATHTHDRRPVVPGGLEWLVGPVVHFFCITFAWVGLLLSLLMLGKEGLSKEESIRWVVGGFTVAAGLILSLDTALPRKDATAAAPETGKSGDAQLSAEGAAGE
jgi:hypothetical protein